MKAARRTPVDPPQLPLLALMEAHPYASAAEGFPTQPEDVSEPDAQAARQTPRLNATATLADVLAALEADLSCERRHIEMKSAVRKMGEVLKRPLFDVPADPQHLRVLIADASRASVGMTKERWSRIRSLTLAALRDLGIDVLPGRDIGGLTPTWSGIAEGLPTKALRVGLSRFMSFCARRRIEPIDVTFETFQAFRTMLEAKSLCRTPDATFRSTVRLWNKAVESVPGWPKLVVSLETHPHFYSLDWAAFPPSFVADVEAFLSNAGSRDELDDDYARAVRPSTVALRRRQLRQLASCLVAGGFPLAQITGLDVLVQLANAKIALGRKRTRHGGKTTPSVGHHAWLLCTIARHWVKDVKLASELREIARRLNVKQKGMTDRTRSGLRQFDLKANVDALLHLPDVVLERAQRGKAARPEGARQVMLAFAVELLIIAPMRVANLTGLDKDRHIVEFGHRRQRNRHILIPPEETKTGELFEVILPPRTVAMMDTYIQVYRKLICPGPSSYLFPNSSGEARCEVAFSQAISQFVERETGIKMHVHLFRHLAGKLHLDANPSDIETVRRVLGHTNASTTARYYAEHRTSQAFRRLDETISELRAPARRLMTQRSSRPKAEVAR